MANRLMLVVVLSTLFLCCACENLLGDLVATRSHDREERAGKQARYTFDDAGAIELVQSIRGALDANDKKVFFVRFAEKEIGDLVLQIQGNTDQAKLDIIIPGTSAPYSYTGNLNSTLSEHCPGQIAKYYLVLSASVAVGIFDLSITKRQQNIMPGTSISGLFRALNSMSFGIPVTSICKRLTVEIQTAAYSLDLTYGCNKYDEKCRAAGSSMPEIYLGGGGTNTFQYIVNCTVPGIYYLRMSSLSSYNITVRNEYPCPDGCWTGGLCNFTTGKCDCNSGFSGTACTKDPPPAIPIIDAPANGDPIEVSMEDVKVSQAQYRFTTPTTSPGYDTIIALNFAVLNPRDQISYSIYFNPDSVVVDRTGAVGSSLFSSKNISEDYMLNGKYAVWYVKIIPNTYYLPNITITARAIDALGTTGNMDGSISSSSKTSLVPVIRRYRPFNTYQMTVHVTENNPGILGIFVYSAFYTLISYASTTFQADPRSNPLMADYTMRWINYQVRVDVTPNEEYYIVVYGTPGSSFYGYIDAATPLGNCSSPIQQRCTAPDHGFCTNDGSCLCRANYEGNACGEPKTPGGTFLVNNGEIGVIPIPNDTNIYASVAYVATQIVPAGYNVRAAFQASYTGSLYIGEQVRLADPLDTNGLSFTPGASGSWYGGRLWCVSSVDKRYYATALSKNGQGGTITMQFNFTDARLPNDGSNTTLDLPAGTNHYVSYLPSVCASVYQIDVYDNDSSVTSVLVSNGANCLENGRILSPTSGSYALPTLNCSYPIHFEFKTNKASTVKISITPASGCPNRCGGSNGKCLASGQCECNYPFVGDDCSSVDIICTALPDEFACASSAPVSYLNNFYKPLNGYCDMAAFSASVPNNIAGISANLTERGITLSQVCLNELQQILCDSKKFKCLNQQRGVKLVVPCNAMTWQARCAPGYSGSLAALDDAIYSVQYYRSFAYVMCNPLPFDPSVTTSQYTLTTTSKPSTTGAVSTISGVSTSNNGATSSKSSSATSQGATGPSSSTQSSTQSSTTVTGTTKSSTAQATTKAAQSTTKSASTGGAVSSTTGQVSENSANKQGLSFPLLFVLGTFLFVLV